MVRAATLLTAPQPTRERPEEQEPLERLSVPRATYNHNLCVHTPQPSICDTHPSPRPAYPTLPLARRPEQQRSDDARDEAHFLQHVHHPVLTAAPALAILPWAQEYEVKEDDEVYTQQCQYEGVLPTARAKREVLGAQGGFEDEQV